MGILLKLIKYNLFAVKSCKFTRLYSAKVPKDPHIPNFCNSILNKTIEIDLQTVRYLERLSLVNFGDYEGIAILESSIKFAENLLLQDTSNIQPLTTVLEDRTLLLREDVVTEGNDRNIVMSNAKLTEEEYYVAPPGNIPLESEEIDYKKEKRPEHKTSVIC